MGVSAELHTIEDVDEPCFQGVLGADDEEAGLPDQLLQDFGAVSKVIG
jgi:hypothetical protein